MRRILVIAVYLTLAASQRLTAVEAFGPRFHRWSPLPQLPFNALLDVNGVEFDVDIQGSGARLRASINDSDELVGITLDSRGHSWISNDVVDFHQVVDGADVSIWLFHFRRAAPAKPRIYARTMIDFNGRSAFQILNTNFGDFTVPLVADSATLLEKHTWEIAGAYGPRYDLPTSLFSGVVGGRQFDVTLREFGFGAWPNIVVKSVPEPSSFALLFTTLLFGAAMARRWRISSADSEARSSPCGPLDE